ncbi:MAG: hypothetical protein ACI8YQ_000204, partial [Polaribacter sp.]
VDFVLTEAKKLSIAVATRYFFNEGQCRIYKYK